MDRLPGLGGWAVMSLDLQPAASSPTAPPPPLHGLGSVLARNIAALQQRRERERRNEGLQTRLADAVTRFTGSMAFVYLHLVGLAFWVAANLGVLPVRPFDRTFVILATCASVEAIFLSTFVLISQNRAAEAADRRADLDLQINLLAEHEVTRLVTLTRAVARKLGVEEAEDADLHELTRDVAPETVMDGIDAAERESPKR